MYAYNLYACIVSYTDVCTLVVTYMVNRVDEYTSLLCIHGKLHRRIHVSWICALCIIYDLLACYSMYIFYLLVYFACSFHTTSLAEFLYMHSYMIYSSVTGSLSKNLNSIHISRIHICKSHGCINISRIYIYIYIYIYM